MSESKFLQEDVADFHKKHPVAAGWKVYRIDARATPRWIPLLPAFLRAKAAGGILREEIYGVVAWDAGNKLRRRALTEPTCLQEGSGLNEDDWYGEVDFLWKGEPIHCIRRFIQKDFGDSHLSLLAAKSRALVEDLYVGLREFERSIRDRHTCILLGGGGAIPRPRTTWDDLILNDRMAADIRLNAESFFKAREQYERMGLPFRRGFLFAGPPGNGKTLTARVIAAQAPGTVFLLEADKELKDYQLGYLFGRLKDEAPATLILEDLDKLAEFPGVSLANILNLMDGIDAAEGVLVIATTNCPEKLDQALRDRPSRFDRVWTFGLPGFEERRRLLEKRGNRRFSGGAIEDAAARTSGFTMAYVQEAVVGACLAAIGEDREPADADLLASVERLKTQQRDNLKSDGSIKPASSVGFTPAGGNGNGNGRTNP